MSNPPRPEAPRSRRRPRAGMNALVDRSKAMLSGGGRFGRDIRRRVLLPAATFTLAAVLLAFAGLYWITTRSDALSIERQTREIHDAINSSVDTVAQAQQGIAMWDEAVLELRKLAPNLDRFNANAIWLRDLFGQDAFFILDQRDRPIYAALDGRREPAARYDAFETNLRRMVDKVRGRIAAPNNRHERLPDQPVHPRTSTHTTDGAVHATGLVEVGGRPAAASVMLNLPTDETIERRAGRESLIICVQYSDDQFLADLSARNLVDGARFAKTADTANGEHALPLASDYGAPIGYIIWRPELPGTKIRWAMAPVTAVTSGIMVLMMGLIARSLFRSVGQQQQIMTELQASEAQAQHLAVHDVLTGVPNRAMFNSRLDHALARGEPATVMLLDLDRFKNVNDTLGHGAGDALIREFCDRLSAIVRGGDLVARLGGDEFAVLCCGVAGLDHVELLATRIIEAVRRPFNLSGVYMTVGVSIGVSSSGNAAANRSELMRKADVALYRAKADGRDCYRVFTPEMDEAARINGEIEAELREALETGEGLEVHYQPQVSCITGAIVGLEALVRWRHPTRGMVLPMQFIAIAEESGLICQLGEWVLRQACLASRRWPELFMAVNFSPIQFRSPGFAATVIAIVDETGADPRRVEIEVTESVLLDDDDLVRDALAAMRAHGFRIALDDFGTGYSSLSYLRRFPVDKIKIDRSFVHQPLYQSADAAAIVTAVLTLGHAMGLTVTAEGVETPEQERFLSAAGCDMMQGYLFSPAVREEEIARMMIAAERAA
jgi:diguanylate cyclase (GGDEF)-like protein